MIRTTALATLVSIAGFSASAHAVSYPTPNAKQRAQITKQITASAERTRFFKGYIGAGMKPTVAVTFNKPAQAGNLGVGTGAPTATVIVYAGNSLYPPTVHAKQPQKERAYVIEQTPGGAWKAVAESKWQQLYTALAAK